VKLRYCDGGSFMGDSAVYINSVCLLFGALVHILFAALDRSTSLPFGICQSWQSSVLYFSGQRIWDAIVADLLRKGLARADKVPRQFSLQPVTPVPPFGTFQHRHHQLLRFSLGFCSAYSRFCSQAVRQEA
jgi:hypothetical protein